MFEQLRIVGERLRRFPRARTALVTVVLLLLYLMMIHLFPAPGRPALAQAEAGREREDGKVKPVPGPRLTEGEPLDHVTLLLTPEGFEPDEVSAHAGKVLLLLQKRVGDRDVSFALRSEEGGTAPHLISLPKGVLRRAEIVELPPGNYTLTADDPAAECKLKVTAR